MIIQCFAQMSKIMLFKSSTFWQRHFSIFKSRFAQQSIETTKHNEQSTLDRCFSTSSKKKNLKTFLWDQYLLFLTIDKFICTKLVSIDNFYEKSKAKSIDNCEFFFISIELFSSTNFSSQRFIKTRFTSLFTSRESHNLNYVHAWIARVNKCEIIRFDSFFFSNFQFNFEF